MIKPIVVNIADMKISKNPNEVLVTYSLGSCVALALYDPYTHISGLIHIMLPESSIEKQNEKANTMKFVDLVVNIR